RRRGMPEGCFLPVLRGEPERGKRTSYRAGGSGVSVSYGLQLARSGCEWLGRAARRRALSPVAANAVQQRRDPLPVRFCRLLQRPIGALDAVVAPPVACRRALASPGE